MFFFFSFFLATASPFRHTHKKPVQPAAKAQQQQQQYPHHLFFAVMSSSAVAMLADPTIQIAVACILLSLFVGEFLCEHSLWLSVRRRSISVQVSRIHLIWFLPAAASGGGM